MTAICGDNRFEIIDKAKKDLIESTNIEMSPDEMKVLDSFLFRCWQMGWLDGYNKTKALMLLLNWAVECDFGYDNFPEEYERYKDDIKDMEYIEGMIYIAEKVLEEKRNESNISN